MSEIMKIIKANFGYGDSELFNFFLKTFFFIFFWMALKLKCELALFLMHPINDK